MPASPAKEATASRAEPIIGAETPFGAFFTLFQIAMRRLAVQSIWESHKITLPTKLATLRSCSA